MGEPLLVTDLRPAFDMALLVSGALAVVLLLLAGGYWYLVVRNHQADGSAEGRADDERGSGG